MSVVRRWTASFSGKLTIKNDLNHEKEKGNGIFYFILSSKSGVLKKGKLHAGKIDFSLTHNVKAGEHIDFVVSPGGGNYFYDGFEWVINMKIGTQTWNSRDDFTLEKNSP